MVLFQYTHNIVLHLILPNISEANNKQHTLSFEVT